MRAERAHEEQRGRRGGGGDSDPSQEASLALPPTSPRITRGQRSHWAWVHVSYQQGGTEERGFGQAGVCGPRAAASLQPYSPPPRPTSADKSDPWERQAEPLCTDRQRALGVPSCVC